MSAIRELLELVRELSRSEYFDKKVLIDVVLSAALKRDHKVFGCLMKRLASVVKSIGVPKGHWQPYWLAATKAFECWKSGWSEHKCVDYAVAAVAGMPNVDVRKVEEIARAVYRQAGDLISECEAWVKRIEPGSTEETRRAPARR